MGLETGTWVNDLVVSNPLSSDQRAQGDDHLRLIKAVLKSTFPNATQAFRFPTSVAEKTGNYTVAVTDDRVLIPVSASGASRTITLPSDDSGVTLKDGFEVTIVRTDSSDNNLVVSAAQNINDATDYYIRQQFELATFRYSLTGSKWFVSSIKTPFRGVEAKSADYTLTIADNGKLLAYTVSGARTLTLPSTLPAGFSCTVVKVDSAAYALTLSAAANINGKATARVQKQYKLVNLYWTGTTWYTDHVPSISTLTPPAGRLTLVSGTPVTTNNVTAAGTVYYTPYNGGRIPIYDTVFADFIDAEFTSELSLALNNPNHAASAIYDVFAFLDYTADITLRIGTGPAWSTASAGSSARGSGGGSTEIVRQKGIFVNANSITLRNGSNTYSVAQYAATYLGSFYTTGIAQTEDSSSKRLLWNMYNRVEKMLSVSETTNGPWNISVSAWALVNASTANRVQLLQGVLEDTVDAAAQLMTTQNTTTVKVATGIGINSTTVNSAPMFGNSTFNAGNVTSTRYRGFAALGYNEINWLEYGENASGTLAGYGDANTAFWLSGMVVGAKV